MITERDLRWDGKIIIVREGSVDSVWDGKIKNLVYNSTTMEWEAQTSSGSGGGGGGPIDADTSSVETRSKGLATQIDQATANLMYVGEAAPGSAASSAVWRIKRMSQSGDQTTIEWADGDSGFNNIWNNRASLSYS